MGEISSALTIFQRAVGSVAIAVLAWITLGMSSAQASESLWSTPIAAASRAQLAERTNELPGAFRSVEADLTGFKYLLTAHNRGEAYPLRVALPLPDGGFQYFLLEPSTLTPELFEASDPDFLLFKGVAEDDSSTRVQFEYSTSFGITARVLDQDGRWFVGPMGGSQLEFSISYYLRDTGTSKGRECGVTGEVIAEARELADGVKQTVGASRASGDKRQTYAIAVLTAESYEDLIVDSDYSSGWETTVYQAVGITLARATGIYETELSITFTNSSTDQRALISADYSGNGPSLDSITGAINSVIVENNYDVGHLFRAGSDAGVAYLQSVCSSAYKGGGLTGMVNPVGDPFDVDYFSHELGHQFGGNHIHQLCNENPGTIVEPGSGSTIMGYAGICPPNVQTNSDPYFHSVNFEEIRAFVESGGGANCDADPATGNSIPTVDAGADYTIPHSTPFVLTGSASDSDGDSLTYSWEQIDNNNPLFRVYNPVSSPSRYFPKLGQTSGFPETLPGDATTLNFRLTARDGNGGRAWDDMQVAVAASGSGFGVTAVTSNGASAEVSWNVDGTDQAPISASQVTFYLSTDSGASYPTEISSATNNGQATVSFPSGIQSSTARLMVKGKDNIFFSTSTQDFSIDTEGVAGALDPGVLWFITRGNANQCYSPGKDITNANFNVAIADWFDKGNASPYGDIGQWCTAEVTDMSSAFKDRTTFNVDISNWDTSNVTNMSGMFQGASAFNRPVGGWNTRKVTSMNSMFWSADSFDQAIGNWNTANVTDMQGMFARTSAFNQSLSSWNTENVTTMYAMFFKAQAFNQPIATWNISRVQSMSSMFYEAVAFDQNLDSWNATSLSSCSAFAVGAATWLAKYSSTIAGKTPPLSQTLINAYCGE